VAQRSGWRGTGCGAATCSAGGVHRCLAVAGFCRRVLYTENTHARRVRQRCHQLRRTDAGVAILWWRHSLTGPGASGCCRHIRAAQVVGFWQIRDAFTLAPQQAGDDRQPGTFGTVAAGLRALQWLSSLQNVFVPCRGNARRGRFGHPAGRASFCSGQPAPVGYFLQMVLPIPLPCADRRRRVGSLRTLAAALLRWSSSHWARIAWCCAVPAVYPDEIVQQRFLR